MLLICCAPALIAQDSQPGEPAEETNSIENQILSQLRAQQEEAVESPSSVEDLKKASLELNRDLLILEEELLFPSNTQVSVFLSVDVGEFFKLDAVKLKTQ